ncbi:MAG TPA: KUP/HAK/KT family potassium transporter, partial [Rhodospirillales bacterium]
MATDLPGSHGAAAPANGNGHPTPASTGRLALTIGAIGVVYGDIGTSPLYAVREAVNAAVGPEGAITQDVILGLLSLIFWALIIVVTFKYIALL